MFELLKPIIIALIPSLVVAFITAFLSVRYSLKRFYSEKWWEKKVVAYTDIMEALYNLQCYVGQELECEMTRREVAEDVKAKLKADAETARQHIEKITGIGAFVISDETVKIIKELLVKLHKASEEESYYEFLDTQGAALSEAMREFRDCAKMDLNI